MLAFMLLIWVLFTHFLFKLVSRKLKKFNYFFILRLVSRKLQCSFYNDSAFLFCWLIFVRFASEKVRFSSYSSVEISYSESLQLLLSRRYYKVFFYYECWVIHYLWVGWVVWYALYHELPLNGLNDELLIWKELPSNFHFYFHKRNHVCVPLIFKNPGF